MKEPRGGLLCGLTAYLINRLCNNGFEGGGEYTPNEVGDMTLDQVFMRLADPKHLAGRRGRGVGVTPLALGPGPVKGRTADGRPIAGRIAGISKARQVQMAADARKKAERDAARQARRERRAKR